MSMPLGEKDPGVVREYIKDSIVAYYEGKIKFPRVRLATSPERLPRKTRPFATWLASEWNVIDNDKAYFEKVVLRTIDTVESNTDVDGNSEKGSYFVAAKIGRNVVDMARVSPGTPISVFSSSCGVGDYIKLFNGVGFVGPGGAHLRYGENGELAGFYTQPDLLIDRPGVPVLRRGKIEFPANTSVLISNRSA